MVAASEMINTIFFICFIRCISPIENLFSLISFIREKLFPVLRLSLLQSYVVTIYCKSAGSLLLMENKSKWL